MAKVKYRKIVFNVPAEIADLFEAAVMQMLTQFEKRDRSGPYQNISMAEAMGIKKEDGIPWSYTDGAEVGRRFDEAVKKETTMKVSLKKAFSLLDGRLSTEMDDIYQMLNFIYDDSIFTHQIPSAMKKLKELSPEWYSSGLRLLYFIKTDHKTDDFGELMKIIDEKYSDYEIELEKIDYKLEFLDSLEK